MEIFIDSSNIQEIKRLCEFLPIQGVTTNPAIIVKEKKPFIPALKEIRALLTDAQSLHAQVLAEKAEQMVEEAEYIHEQLEGKVFVKIPANIEGIKAIKELHEKGIRTTATTVYTPLQALLAAQAGASYVAPYVNRVDNLMADGVSCVSSIAKVFAGNEIECKILAASFKNTQQILQVIEAGAHSVTVNPELLDAMLGHPSINQAVEDFRIGWEKEFGTLAIK